MAAEKTTTDVGATRWQVDDEPLRFRQWGTDNVWLLPLDRTRALTIGSDPDREIRLDDAKRTVSKRHARAVHDGTRWLVRDDGSKNGVLVAGTRVREAVLVPGLEIEIGGVTLIVESTRFLQLRAYVARLVGYAEEKLAEVDRVLRAIRMAGTDRVPLVLQGEGNLVAIARDLHRHTLGASRPFIVCDPRRAEASANARSAENYPTAVTAMQAAIGGSLCVWSKRLPSDFSLVSVAMREPGVRFQLIMCGGDKVDLRPEQVPPIVIPSLGRRSRELVRIVEEYASDARESFGGAARLAAEDREWILENSARTLADIQSGTPRVVALRACGGNAAAAATRLGLNPTSLTRWLNERSPLPDIL
ncbi:MAG: FHA domain-containing protein [Kofleriaceae bacterium]|nr:FHA domain-containing protein [Kofleriaceae bacterium]